MDSVAIGGDSGFFIECDDSEICATSNFCGFQQTVYFTLFGGRVGHRPCHLNELCHQIVVLHHEITFTVFFEIGDFLVRLAISVEMQKHIVFEQFSFIVALWQQHSIANAIVHAVVFIERLLLFDN